MTDLPETPTVGLSDRVGNLASVAPRTSSHLGSAPPADDVLVRASLPDDIIVLRARLLCLAKAERDAGRAYRDAVKARRASRTAHRDWIRAKARLCALRIVL